MRSLPSFLLPTALGIFLASTGFKAAANRALEIPRVKTKTVVSLLARPVVAGRNIEEGLYDPAEGLLKRGSREEKTLVLTFDDGPHPDCAARLLDELKELDVKATFFVVGERVKQRPDVVRRMLAEGHEVGNHTQDHARLHELSPLWVKNELEYCETNVRRATGHSMAFMRPPGMRYNAKVLAESRAQGYVMVGYNNVAGDYVPNGGVSDLTPEEASALGLDAKTIADRIEKQLKPGTIILLHDNPVTVSAIPDIVARARAQGYRFVTTAELMASLPEPIKIVANPLVKR